MKLFHKLTPYFLISALILLCVTACQKISTNETQELTTVVVTPATKQDVIESMKIVGQVVAKESVYLRARVKGFLEKRNFIEGSFVTKNELLFQIEKTEYDAKVESAEAQLDTAKANLKNDTIDYERQKYLADRDAVSQRNFDKATAQKAISEAGVLSAEAELKETKLNLSYTNIKAPFNGRIGLAKYSVGNVVGPNSEPLAQVVMVDPIRVEFNLTESFIMTILQEKYMGNKMPNKSGKKASFKSIVIKLILSNGTKFPNAGEIDFIDNVINPMTGTILMRAIFSNPKALLIPGAYVKVILATRDKVERLLIPQAAIQEDQTGKFVLVVNKDNKVEIRNIKTESIYGVNIVVKSGLKEGELVIKEGLQKVREGLTVKTLQEKLVIPKPPKTKKTETDKKAEKNTPPKTEVKKSAPKPKKAADKQNKAQGQ